MNAVTIGGKRLSAPIIQGGMGVGISLGNLAGHVAACGGMGVISSAHAGYGEPDFWQAPQAANHRAILAELAKARAIGPEGFIAVNIMVAVSDYADHVAAAVAGGADAIISGAGLPLNLPQLTAGSDVLLAPIVSSAKAAAVLLRAWDKKYQRTADFLIVEGSEAGGHLGFKREELLSGATKPLSVIVTEVLAVAAEFAAKYKRPIPVFAAGGIYTYEDIKATLALGAAGVQMATRFIATEECDAAPEYKAAYLRAQADDIALVASPVGMPGRAIRSPLLERLAQTGRIPVKHCLRCLKPCDPAQTPYCITKALIEAAQGNWQEGLFFTGSNGYRLEKIVTVAQLMAELTGETREYD